MRYSCGLYFLKMKLSFVILNHIFGKGRFIVFIY